MTGILVILAFALMASVVIRPGQGANGGSVLLPQLEYKSFWFGLAFFALVFSVFRAQHATGLVIGLLVHELGHYLSLRLCGHHEARFRLLPMAARHAALDKELRSDAEAAFVALMGAGVSIVPMVLLIGLGLTLGEESSLHTVLMPMGAMIAALNVINLLPLWPLDGGRCLALICRSLSPRAMVPALLAVSAFTAAFAIHLQSTTLAMTCLVGVHYFFFPQSLSAKHPAMPKRTALLVGLTWAFLAATHLAGGWWMLEWFYFSGF